MGNIIASELLPSALQYLFRIGRKNKISTAFLVFLQLFLFTTLIFPQSPAIKKALEEYEKNMYPWKPPEYEQPVGDSILTVLGRWAWGPCHAVDVKGNYAYIGNGPTFHILDISDPTQPEIVGEFITEGYVYDIKVRENTAFIGIGSGLLILNVSDPAYPQQVSFINIEGLAGRIAIDGSFVYVAAAIEILWVVDISDINNPYLRGSTFTDGIPSSLTAKDSYVYVGNLEVPAIKIINATNPDSLTGFFYGVGGRAISLFIKDTLLFAGVSWTTTNFKIYGISNPLAPQLKGQVEIAPSVLINGITVSEDGLIGYAQCLTSSNPSFTEGIFSIDISDTNQPVILDKFERRTQIGAAGISVAGNNLVSAYFSGSCVVDVSNPSSLFLKSFFSTGGFSEKIAVQDNYAFIASGLSGLWILDVSNPTKPKAISNIQTGGFTVDLTVEDMFVFIVNTPVFENGDSTRGLWIIDVSDINNPTIIYHYIGIINATYSGVFNSVINSENLVFITQAPVVNNNDILEIIDITDPKNPNSLGIFQGFYRPHNVAVNDTIIYLGTSDGGVRIIDISDKSNPIELSNILNASVGLVYQKPFVYSSTAIFSIINVDDPYNPYIISSVQTHTSSGDIDIFIADDYAYWAEWVLGIIDIKDTFNPTPLTTFTGRDRGRGVSVKSDKIFFADQTQGVWIIKNNLITDINEEIPIIYNYQLLQCYPNPFNPSTIIEFSLPSREKIKLEVFDLLGRKLSNLIDAEIDGGKHKIEFNAAGLSSGIYFYRLTTPKVSITRKMMVLR